MESDKKLKTAAHRLHTDDGEMPQTAQIHHLPRAEQTDPWLDLGQGPAPIVEEPDEVRQAYDKLDSNLVELAATPTLQEFESEQRARKRMGKFILGLIVLAILLGYGLTWYVSDRVAKESTRTEILRGTVASLEKANQQRAALGLPPVPVQAIVDRLDQNGIVDAVTASVIARIQLDSRYRGAAGADGLPGSAGLPGAPGAPGTAGEPGATGTPGANGQPGVDGQPGNNGADGRNGIDGTNGKDGATGPAGPACPEGFSLKNVTFGDGQTGTACVTNPQ